MAKLPIKVREELIKMNTEKTEWFTDIINRKKANDPYLAAWLAEKPTAYYEGLRDGNYAAIESMLMAYRAYGGFLEKDGMRDYFIK